MLKLRKQYFSLITLIALTISTMIPFFASYSYNITDTTRNIAEFFGGKILICTDRGFKWININDIEKEKEPSPSENYKCPLCYIASNKPSCSAANYVHLSHHTLSTKKAFYHQAIYSFSPDRISTNIKTRAPPFSFVI